MKKPDWSKAEREAYKPRPYDRLQELYKERGIPASDPAARAQLLSDILELTYADDLGILVILNRDGKAKTLNYLEDAYKSRLHDVLSAKLDRVSYRY